MQSGISVSDKLQQEFKEFVSSLEHFGLLITVADESLQIVTRLTPTSPWASASASFATNLTDLLTPHVRPTEPLYILLRRYDSAPHFTAVTYVPDAASIRKKMLFASTRLTLVRELGSEHFRDSVFATSPDDLTPQGFERQAAHEAHAAPLTEKEERLGEVKRAELEAGLMGSAVREIHLSKSMTAKFDEEALAELRRLKEGTVKGSVMLKINTSTETLELVPSTSTSTSLADLVSAISTTEPRFTFCRYANPDLGDPLLFFYTCPASPERRSIRTRMMYPLMKRAVLEATKREGLEVVKAFEFDGPAEITETAVLEDLQPKAQVKPAFSRPQRPGR